MKILPSRSHAVLTVLVFALAACRQQKGIPAASSSDSASAAASGQPATTNALVISRHEDRIFAGGIAPPAEKFTNTASQDAKAADAGAALFTGMNCDGCHGGGAVGAVGPSLTDGRWRYGGADADIYRSIAEGRPKGMPAFGGVLQPAMIWRLVAYIKSLPAPKDAPTESW
jgi:cytochrome c oxidase cbb3-type subunit 3